MMGIMIGAIYARVSTPGQLEDGTILETQVEACRKLAKERGINVPPHLVFQEQGSGTDSNRPMLSKIQLLAKKGKIDALIIYDPDRLSRDTIDLMNISEEISEAGIELLFIHGPSGNSPEDKLLRFIFGYKGEAERRDTIERTTRGKRKTASNGKLPIGTGKGLYGYRFKWVIDDHTQKPRQVGREIIEDEAEVVREVFELAISGLGAHRIAMILNGRTIPSKTGTKWHQWTIKNMLKNSAYMGVTYYGKERVYKPKNSMKRVRTPVNKEGWILVPGFTPPIISEEVFMLAQSRLSEPKFRPGKAIQPYLLKEHIVCGHCSTPMIGTMLNRRYRYYRCRGTWPTASTPKYCHAKYIRSERLEEVIWNIVRETLEHPEVVLDELRRIKESEQNPIDEEMARVEHEIRRCKDQERRLVKLYQFGEVDDGWIKMQSGPVKLMRERYEAELQRLNVQKITLKDLERKENQLREFCQRVRSNLDTFNFEEKRMALQALQIKATVTENDVRVKGILGVTGGEPNLATTARTSA